MTVEFNPDDISKKMFMKELLAARERLGSTVKVSLALNLEPRRCQAWVSGDMPAYATMQQVYLRLMEIAKTSDSEIGKIVQGLSKRGAK